MNSFKARSVMASRRGDHVVGLRFFAAKEGNAPANSFLIEFEGINLEQLIGKLQDVRTATPNPHTGKY